MPSPDTRKKVLSFGALVLPVVIVKLAATVLGQSGAATASAAPRPTTTDAAVSATTPAATKLTARQLAAAEYVQSMRQRTFGRAPLLFEPRPPSNEPNTSSTPEVTPVVDSHPNEPLPMFTLNAVMSSSSGQRALINGRPYRVGDTIKETAWTVLSIDVAGRSATLQDSHSDRTVMIAVERPL